jgi:ribosomal protein S19
MKYLNRTFRRLPNFSFLFLKISKKRILRTNKAFKIYSKSFRLIFLFLKLKFLIYNGRFLKMYVFKNEELWYRFGEFLFTRRFGLGKHMHLKKKKKLIKKK